MRTLRAIIAIGMTVIVSPVLGAAGRAAMWLPSGSAGVTIENQSEDRAEIVSSIRGEFTVDSIASLPARPGDGFSIELRVKVGIDMSAQPELVCFDAQGREVPPPAWMVQGSRPSTTKWQAFTRTFVVLPNTATVRVRLRGHGRGTVLAEGLALRRAEIDTYRTGALVARPHPRTRAGVLLESNFGIVNRELITTADRDGDGKWALIIQNLDELTAPETKGEDWRSNWEDNPNVILWTDGAVLKSDTIHADRPPDTQRALHFRARVHAGPYRVQVGDPGRPVAVSLDGRTWKRAEPGDEIDLGVLPIADGVVEVWIDACYVDSLKPGPAYFDYVRLTPALNAPSIERLFAAAGAKPPQISRGSIDERRVPILAEPLRLGKGKSISWPVRCGLPIPRGELVSAEHVAVLDATGARIPSQNRVLATWPDGSVKWLFLDFMSAGAGANAADYTVAYGNRIAAAQPIAGVRIERTARGVNVDTGALRFHVSGERFGFVEDVRLPSGQIVQRDPIRAEIVETSGRVWSALDLPPTRLEIEQAGPLHAVIRVETKLAPSGKPAEGFHHRARIHAHAGSPLVAVDYFVANTDSRPAKDVGGSMASKVAIKSFALRLEPAAAIVSARHDAGAIPATTGARVQKTEEVALDVTGSDMAESRAHVRGWLGLSLAHGGSLHVGVADFREQFPKALRWSPSGVSIDLWAAEGGDFDWIEGVGKTHHLTFLYGAEPPGEELLVTPVLATAAPEWYVRSGALGEIGTAAESGHAAIEHNLAGHMKNPVVERVGLGFENYGDHNSSGYVKGFPLWDNNEYDMPAACLVHFARTGDRDALRLGLASAQHYLDVDTIHYSSEHAAWARAQHVHSHGLFGHHTAQGPDYNHAGYVQGLIWHTFFTGDAAGIEGARGIADWATRSLPVLTNGLERVLGHTLMTCNDVYEATGDEKYLRAAAACVDQALKWEHPVRSGFLARIFERPVYYSGAPFCNGVLSAGLIKFNDWAQLPELDALLERFARWNLTDGWKPPAGLVSKGGPPRAGGDPQHIGNQGRLMARVFARTKDPLYLAVPWILADLGYGEKARPIFGTRSTGLVYNHLPWLLAAWSEQGNPTPEPQLEVAVETGSVTLAPGTAARLVVRVKNAGPEPIDDLRISFNTRLDFAVVTLQPPPARLLPGQTAACTYEVRAPVHVNLSTGYNSIAHGHWSALYRRGDRRHLAHTPVKIVLEGAAGAP